MNIWIINHYAATPSLGRSNRHYELGKRLVELGHNVTVIAADRHHGLYTDPTHNNTIFRLNEGGVDFLLLKTPPYKGNGIARIANIVMFTKAVLGLKNYKGNLINPDIIVGSSVHPFAAWAAERLSRYYNIPFCFEVRDLWPQTLVDMGVIKEWNPVTIFLKLLEKYLYNRSVRIIVLLPFAHEYIANYGIPESKVEYLPNGVDVLKFPINSAKKESKTLTVMYIGSHGKANSIDSLIEAAVILNEKKSQNHLIDVQWRFIGEGSDKTRLEKKATEMGTQNVTFEPGVQKKKIPSIMQEADILIVNLLNLRIYQFGISLNKLFEYLAAAKPIVFGCDARNNPVKEAGAGVSVSAGDPKALAHAVEEICKLSEDERLSMGLNGRRYVETHHGFNSLGDRLEAILKHASSTSKRSL